MTACNMAVDYPKRGQINSDRVVHACNKDGYTACGINPTYTQTWRRLQFKDFLKPATPITCKLCQRTLGFFEETQVQNKYVVWDPATGLFFASNGCSSSPKWTEEINRAKQWIKEESAKEAVKEQVCYISVRKYNKTGHFEVEYEVTLTVLREYRRMYNKFCSDRSRELNKYNYNSDRQRVIREMEKYRPLYDGFPIHSTSIVYIAHRRVKVIPIQIHYKLP